MGLAITCTNIRIEPLVIQGTIKQAALYAYSNTIEAPDPTGNRGAGVLIHAEQPLQTKIKGKVN